MTSVDKEATKSPGGSPAAMGLSTGGAGAASSVVDWAIGLLGWRVTLLFGDPTVLDRWRFLARRLPHVRGTNEKVLDLGCGTGAMTMGIASRGYAAVGLSYDARNQAVAAHRADLSGLKNISFPIGDVRRLHERSDWFAHFDAIVCFETVEHILDDRKLFRDMFRCLKPGGRLLLTTPNYYYRSSEADIGPFSLVEDGWHVRRGYSPAMLRELCDNAGFIVEEITCISHFFSQLGFRLQHALARARLGRSMGQTLQWLLTAPVRLPPLLFDSWVGRWIGAALGWPGYSIALVAYKPRFGAAFRVRPDHGADGC